MRHPLRLTLCASLVLAACGQAEEASELGSLTQAIVNGDESGPEDDTAVYVYTAPDQACSGTVIAPNLVATALHCVTDSNPRFFACNTDGTLSDESSATGDGRLGALVPPENVSIRVGAQTLGVQPVAFGERLFGTGATQICRGDIAFIVLDRALDVPVTPVRLDYGVRSGDRLRVMGYGKTESSHIGVRLVRSGVRVIDVGPTSEDEPSITAAPRTFVVYEGPCQGDSGGPAFSEDTGALVGVYSLAAGDTCTSVGVRNVYTSLSSYAGLAREAFAAAGAEPILDEPEAEPEAPPIVPDGGCNLAHSRRDASSGASGLLAAAALGLAFSLRRKRG